MKIKVTPCCEALPEKGQLFEVNWNEGGRRSEADDILFCSVCNKVVEDVNLILINEDDVRYKKGER
jgi:hypothetical protein